ncbi:ATP-binding protein [Saccharibacillus alkalitolerans]|uniref:AAA family ATPase n=1 Tax=Saccharibacillus alkalitolerans TaxID=2705290 RepID=A0ABX0FCL3_9BACL|nr:ATP-binding protein [Saccharibacillus alkalitolerans]NGZ77081.1 AAA family ATPase [Saccharibacillus alkalitolerans]
MKPVRTNTIHMLIGIPGSGKSVYAQKLEQETRGVIVSTDAIRLKLFGGESRQKNTYVIFDEAFREIGAALEAGRDVIFDATNVDRDRRGKFVKRFADCRIEAHVFDTLYETAVRRISSRKRKLDGKIMAKYAKNLQFPLPGEGFEAVHPVHMPDESVLCGLAEPPRADELRSEIERLLRQEAGHDELFAVLSAFPLFAQMLGYDQGNPFHTRTLSQHTYAVLEYVNAFYEEDDRLAMQWTALLHDIGKPFCKTWKEARGYYSYFGHEHVSASIGCHLLKALGYSDDFALDVAGRIECHMEILHGGDAGASNIYHLLGGEKLAKMYFFAEADTYGK